MDQRPKCTKCKMIKILENNIGENLGDLGYDNDFSDITSKVLSMKKKSISWTSLTLKTSALWKITSRKWEDRPQIGRNICKRHSW